MSNLTFLETMLIWLFAPIVPVLIIAVILSLTPLKPPKNQGTSWLKDNKW